jgi:hypothetical protein
MGLETSKEMWFIEYTLLQSPKSAEGVRVVMMKHTNILISESCVHCMIVFRLHCDDETNGISYYLYSRFEKKLVVRC